MVPGELQRQQTLPTIDLKFMLDLSPRWTLLAPHPGLKTGCELDMNLSATHKFIENIHGEKEQMIGHSGYFLLDSFLKAGYMLHARL